MMKFDGFLRPILLALLVGLSPRLAAADDPAEEIIDSLLVRNDDVFASTDSGLYRALLSERKWRRLDTPKSMPLGGEFAAQPPDSELVVYHPRDRGEKIHPGGYVSKDNGRTWRYGGGEYRFKHLFLHPDGTLYGIPVAFSGRDEALRSDDLGAHWENIIFDIPRAMTLWGFSVGQKHPDGIRVHGGVLRGMCCSWIGDSSTGN